MNPSRIDLWNGPATVGDLGDKRWRDYVPVRSSDGPREVTVMALFAG
jgi:hypothetical protein